MKLKRSFFTQPTLKIAKDLLGKYIVRKIGRKTLVGKIVETEAYIGPQDRASHAFGNKKTPRNQAEWLIGGHIYIYLVYGMYWQLNISTGKAGRPECVLIRALEPVTLNRVLRIKKHVSKIKNYERKLLDIKSHNTRFMIRNSKVANGPGKLCRWLKLNKSFYGEDITKSKRIWLVSLKGRTNLKRSEIKSGPRIGIDYAGPKWAKKPWRFWIKSNMYVSSK